MIVRRIQMTRNRAWRAVYPDAVIVDRRTKWGNPYRVVPVHRSGPFDVWHGDRFIGQYKSVDRARRAAVKRYRHAVERMAARGATRTQISRRLRISGRTTKELTT